MAQHSYDDSSRLREQWDPRISAALNTTYAYGSAPPEPDGSDEVHR
ncbi:hypothetical protein [Streptomyces sp. NPDC051642]